MLGGREVSVSESTKTRTESVQTIIAGMLNIFHVADIT